MKISRSANKPPDREEEDRNMNNFSYKISTKFTIRNNMKRNNMGTGPTTKTFFYWGDRSGKTNYPGKGRFNRTNMKASDRVEIYKMLLLKKAF